VRARLNSWLVSLYHHYPAVRFSSVVHPNAPPQRSLVEISRPAKFALITKRRVIVQRKEETLFSLTSGKSAILQSRNVRACELRVYCSQGAKPLPRGGQTGSSRKKRVVRGTMDESTQRGHEQSNPVMSDRERIDVEPPDHLCKRCGHPKPRLVFDQVSLLLLCEQCLECVQRSQAWSVLREDETA
jgi:hypothetical protein